MRTLRSKKIPTKFSRAVLPHRYKIKSPYSNEAPYLQQAANKMGLARHFTQIELEQLPDEWSLTEREKEILRSLKSGLSNKKLAYEMGLDPSYFNNALAKIYKKLDVSTRTQALLKLLDADTL